MNLLNHYRKDHYTLIESMSYILQDMLYAFQYYYFHAVRQCMGVEEAEIRGGKVVMVAAMAEVQLVERMVE